MAAGGLLAARVAKEATSSIPVIFDTGTDPVGAGLVASMARPGGNLTGLAILTSDLNPKRLELLMEMVPTAAAVAVLVNGTNATTDRVISEVQSAERAKQIHIQVVMAATEEEYEPAFSRARAEAGALLVGSDPVLFSRRERLVALAARHALRFTSGESSPKSAD